MADIGADSTAIAWVIAKNKEREDSFLQQKKSYRKGIQDGNKGANPGELSEDTIIDLPSGQLPDIPLSPDNPTGIDGSELCFGDLSRGIYFKAAHRAQGIGYIKIWIDDYVVLPYPVYQNGDWDISKGRVNAALWDEKGTLLKHNVIKNADNGGLWTRKYFNKDNILIENRYPTKCWIETVHLYKNDIYFMYDRDTGSLVNTYERATKYGYLLNFGGVSGWFPGSFTYQQMSTTPFTDNLEPIPDENS